MLNCPFSRPDTLQRLQHTIVYSCTTKGAYTNWKDMWAICFKTLLTLHLWIVWKPPLTLFAIFNEKIGLLWMLICHCHSSHFSSRGPKSHVTKYLKINEYSRIKKSTWNWYFLKKKSRGLLPDTKRAKTQNSISFGGFRLKGRLSPNKHNVFLNRLNQLLSYYDRTFLLYFRVARIAVK